MTTTYTPLYTTTLGSTSSGVVISSFPSTYTDLILVVNGKADSGSTGSIGLQYNSDTGSHYSYTRILGDGTNASSARGSNTSATYIGDTGTDPAVFIVSIQNYSNTTTYKTHLSRSNSQYYVSSYVGLWRGSTGSSTDAITSIKVLPPSGANWAIGSTFSLYGVASTQALATTKATGGDSIVTSGG